jgi:hypothetical protein
MADYGIRVSEQSESANNASDAKLFMTTKYPFAKLDTQKTESFQTINLTFLNDPPEPAGTPGNENLDTLVYSFTHGYSYVPMIWTLGYVLVAPAASSYTDRYFQDSALLASNGGFDGATFYTTFDASKVYFYVRKYKDNAFGGLANNLLATQLQLRTFVFVEELDVL